MERASSTTLMALTMKEITLKMSALVKANSLIKMVRFKKESGSTTSIFRNDSISLLFITSK